MHAFYPVSFSFTVTSVLRVHSTDLCVWFHAAFACMLVLLSACLLFLQKANAKSLMAPKLAASSTQAEGTCCSSTAMPLVIAWDRGSPSWLMPH